MVDLIDGLELGKARDRKVGERSGGTQGRWMEVGDQASCKRCTPNRHQT